jgi:D-alanine-D-alanine ligase
MDILILHNSPAQDALADENDVLEQVDAVHEALRGLGHQVSVFACSLDLGATLSAITDRKPDIVFNLVESLAQTDRLAPLVTMLMDALRMRYTGSSTWPLHRACGKITTKRLLRAANLPTASWVTGPLTGPESARGEAAELRTSGNSGIIVKPVWEHASFGMDESSVFVPDTAADIESVLRSKEAQSGRPWFAEHFIDGREFNLSLLQSTNDSEACMVLPPAEICFVNFPPESPHIVCHNAKWDGQSNEYQRTLRRFEFPDDDQALLDELARLAGECWRLFDLSGYARVDFRVDRNGQPWILEVNANPCLTPDAGFAAAAGQADIGYAGLIERIVDTASYSRH